MNIDKSNIKLLLFNELTYSNGSYTEFYYKNKNITAYVYKNMSVGEVAIDISKIISIEKDTFYITKGNTAAIEEIIYFKIYTTVKDLAYAVYNKDWIGIKDIIAYINS